MPSPNFRILSMAIVIAGLGLGFAVAPAAGDRDDIMLTLLLAVMIPWFLEIVFPFIREIFLRLVRPQK